MCLSMKSVGLLLLCLSILRGWEKASTDLAYEGEKCLSNLAKMSIEIETDQNALFCYPKMHYFGIP